MIRDARFTDIPGIVILMQEGYLRSHYHAEGRCEIDIKEAKRLLVQAIQRHGHKSGGGCFVQASETGGQITGFIVGTLARVYAVGTRLMATDLFWTAGKNAEPGDAMKLMRGMIEWSRSCPDVIETKCGTTAIIHDDPEAAGVILQRLGMKPYGRIWRMEN